MIKPKDIKSLRAPGRTGGDWIHHKVATGCELFMVASNPKLDRDQLPYVIGLRHDNAISARVLAYDDEWHLAEDCPIRLAPRDYS